MMQHITDDQDALLDYLYEEGDAAERLKIARHLQECAPCSVAVLEFQNVRGMLRDWTPPASELGFRIVQETPLPAVPARALWTSRFGNWTQAAAAAVLFAAGFAVSQFSMSYSDGALTVRMGPAESLPSVQTARARTASIDLPAESPVGISNSALAVQTAAPIDTEQLLQRVRSMIDQSEQRQKSELALRISQVTNEEHTQHQADLLRIQQNMGQQQDDFMNYLVRTSGGVVK